MEFYEMTARDTAQALGVDIENGLSEKEAQKRLNRYGKNELKAEKKVSLIHRFFKQFDDFMIMVLLGAAALSFFTSLANGEHNISEPLVILIIVTLNAVLGTIQEVRAEHSIESLKKMSSPTARVIRDGGETKISSQFVVPGDIIKVKTGDIICADCRLIHESNLTVNESTLTGEAMEIKKDATAILPPLSPISDLKNTIMAGCSVSGGEATAVVTKTGMDTQMGKIAQMLNVTDTTATPLQKRLEKTGKALGVAAIIVCAVIFIIGIYRHIPPLDMFMTSVSLAVAAIPEGLPAIVTILLALGVMRMSRHNAIVRNLPSVETLGCATVICTDKTGTLTKNEMRVAQVRTKNLPKLLRLATLCTEDGKYINPTDRAILDYCTERGIDTKSYKAQKPKAQSVPFSSERKRMSVIADRKEIVKGASEFILRLCTKVDTATGVEPLDAESKRRIEKEIKEMTSGALRVIALAYRDGTKITEKELIFSGLIGIYDPPRQEARSAVLKAQGAGINTIMITGDDPNTALAIAKETGIINECETPITGGRLDSTDDEELTKIVKTHHIFARVTPEHKLRIVKALQKNGEVCAMTGDGVNDAPALKGADIGCSMGLCGTDVAKSASDIILTDDNFATIVYAVGEGRGIYDNILKSIKFLLSSNIGEILTILFAIIYSAFSPLTALQLLWINLVTDSLPAIALGLDPKDEAVMHRPPMNAKKGLISPSVWAGIVLEGLMIGGLSLVGYGLGLVISHNPITARTVSFFVLSVSQLIHAFNMRSEKSVLNRKLIENKYLVMSFVLGLTAQLLIMYIPVLQELFRIVPLGGITLTVAIILSLMPLFIVELQKYLNGLISREK